MIGCSVFTARRMVEGGTFPGAFRPDSTGWWRIPKDEVEAWLSSVVPLRRRPTSAKDIKVS
jgi:hypothetical protein